MNLVVKKAVKIGAIAVGIMVVILITITIFLTRNLDKFIYNKLADEVHKSTNGLYILKLDELSVNIAKGRLSFKNATLYPDSVISIQMREKGQLPASLYTLHTQSGEIEISGFGEIYKNWNIGVKNIHIESPAIYIVNNESMLTNTLTDSLPQPSGKKELPAFVKSFFSKINIDELSINNGSIEYRYEGIKDTTEWTANNVHVKLDSVLIDSIFTTMYRFPFPTDMLMNIGEINHYTTNNATIFTLEGLKLNLRDSLVSIDSLKLVPQYSKYKYAPIVHSDWTELKTGHIELTGIKFSQLLYSNIVFIDTILIDGVDVVSFKNKKIAMPRRKKPLFSEMLWLIPVKFDIPKIFVQNSTAVYEELSINGRTPGKVNFTDIKAEITGLTNIMSNDKKHYTIKAFAKLFGEGELNSLFTYTVDSLNNHFEINGTLGKMNMTLANSMATPLADIQIGSGTVNRIDFSISGNKHHANLNMQFLYNNLWIDLYKETKKDKHKRRGFLSFLANNFALISDNPSVKKPRRVNTQTPADQSRSNFNYLWRIMRDGMKETFGL